MSYRAVKYNHWGNHLLGQQKSTANSQCLGSNKIAHNADTFSQRINNPLGFLNNALVHIEDYAVLSFDFQDFDHFLLITKEVE